MDYGLMLWGALTLLAILGALSLVELAGEFHRRGMERVRKGGKNG